MVSNTNERKSFLLPTYCLPIVDEETSAMLLIFDGK